MQTSDMNLSTEYETPAIDSLPMDDDEEEDDEEEVHFISNYYKIKNLFFSMKVMEKSKK
jgi:hypothetical protein